MGYYQANERLDDSELSGPGRRFADRIEALCPGAVALVVRARVIKGGMLFFLSAVQCIVAGGRLVWVLDATDWPASAELPAGRD